MVYADYPYYTNVYWGKTVSEEDWPRLVTRASAFLDYATMGRAAKHAAMEAVKLACCALAERYQTIETAQALAARSLKTSAESAATDEGELSSQTVGDWTRSFKSGGSSAKDALSAATTAQETLLDTVRMYLGGTGLLRARGYWT